MKKCLLYNLLLSLSLLISCSEDKTNNKINIMSFVTKEGISTTLNIKNEIYISNTNKNLYYMNFRYYSQNKNQQWQFSLKPNGPWSVYLDQSRLPQALKNINLLNNHQ
jgi:NAD-specific glutamate dehydrogenase